jgi:SAM-dependent methyltransferase
MFDDAANAACLAEAARVLRPGGRLLVHHANPLRLAREPRATARRVLADGAVVEEESVFDAARGVDRCARRLVRPSGEVLAATAELRYYAPGEWRALAAGAGLRLAALTSTPGAHLAAPPEPGPEAPDLVAALDKPAAT